MRALILNCTLKKSPAPSNTDKLAALVADGLREHGVTVETVRVADQCVEPGIETDEENRPVAYRRWPRTCTRSRPR